VAEKEGCADFRGRIAEILPGAPPRRHARDAQIGHACVSDGRCIATMTRHTRIGVLSILILRYAKVNGQRLMPLRPQAWPSKTLGSRRRPGTCPRYDTASLRAHPVRRGGVFDGRAHGHGGIRR
jgi:hypothetical protein